MSTSIRETVNSVLTSQGVSAQQYSRYTEPVITALEQQVTGIAEAARRVMAEKGLSDTEANSILVTIGLVPEQETTATTSANTTASADSGLAARVERLEQFAAQHGLRL